MPDVELTLSIQAPIDRVWDSVIDLERYPGTMESVQEARIIRVLSPTLRHCAWSVTLKGAILRWEEEERIDRERRIVTFRQLAGDLESFDGFWTLTPEALGSTHVTFFVTFEIGIPLLAETLNPAAQRALGENCKEMLRGVEAEALAGAP